MTDVSELIERVLSEARRPERPKQALRDAADALEILSERNAVLEGALERFEGFALTMFRAFLLGLERNGAHVWMQKSSDVAERNLKAALQDYRIALTKEGVDAVNEHKKKDAVFDNIMHEFNTAVARDLTTERELRMGKLTLLAEQCEAATGPDRELDCIVHAAVKGWPLKQEGNDFIATVPNVGRVLVGWIDPGKTARNFTMTTDSFAPTYTSSIEAAMTLVPDGWHISFLHQDRYTQAPMLALERNGDNSGKIAPCEEAATLALAFCAAALRARHSTPDTGKDG